MHGLTGGKQVMVYGQTEVTRDLMDARIAWGLPTVYGAANVSVHDFDGNTPKRAYEKDGRSSTRYSATSSPAATAFTACAAPACPGAIQEFEKVYPFGWLGLLADVPPVSHELIYATPNGALRCVRSAA
jgi:p-hydroxybenzoate 3-monooxygenase